MGASTSYNPVDHHDRLQYNTSEDAEGEEMRMLKFKQVQYVGGVELPVST
jgi:hypothetical protein